LRIEGGFPDAVKDTVKSAEGVQDGQDSAAMRGTNEYGAPTLTTGSLSEGNMHDQDLKGIGTPSAALDEAIPACGPFKYASQRGISTAHRALHGITALANSTRRLSPAEPTM
jgi:hypothetical protein